MLKEWWSSFPWYLRNRYILTLIVFSIWMMFFDENNLINQVELRSELYELEEDRAYYFAEIISIREDLEELLSDNQKLETFAREKYLMKRPNEEIFIFVEED